jgi:Acyl-CoA thioester hydrolase/BAAT N-terminal region
VNLGTAAPRSGSYTGAHATGLLWSMRTSAAEDLFGLRTDPSMTVTVTASQDGGSTSTAVQTRWLRPPGVTLTRPDRATVGFVGAMFTPAGTVTNTSAMLVFGGSEGGLGSSFLTAEALASKGHPVLALAYFGTAGVPSAAR